MNNIIKKIKLNEIVDNLDDTYTVFICSGSYEERCKSIPRQFNSETFQKVFICFNKDHEKQVGENASTIFKLFPSSAEFIELNSSSQIKTADIFIKKVGDFLSQNVNAKILLDITTFRRQALLILLRVLRALLKKENKITFCYTPAFEYSVGLEDEEKWLSRNIVDVKSILGYSGIMMPTKPIHLIILAGLEFERAISLINEYQPNAVSIGYPSRSSSSEFKHYELNLKKVNLIKEEYPSANVFEFTCDDVIKTKDEIEEQIELFKNYNNIISPMNNKLSTLAAALVAFRNKHVQLSYASAAFYNIDNYSIPSDYCFIFDIKDFIKKGK